MSRVGKSPDRFDPPEPLLLGRDPGVIEPRCEGDMKVKRFREGVLGVVGGREERVDERGGVRGGSMRDEFADNSSPNISFLMSARYILSASSSDILDEYFTKTTSLRIDFSCAMSFPRFRRGIVWTFQQTETRLQIDALSIRYESAD